MMLERGEVGHTRTKRGDSHHDVNTHRKVTVALVIATQPFKRRNRQVSRKAVERERRLSDAVDRRKDIGQQYAWLRQVGHDYLKDAVALLCRYFFFTLSMGIVASLRANAGMDFGGEGAAVARGIAECVGVTITINFSQPNHHNHAHQFVSIITRIITRTNVSTHIFSNSMSILYSIVQK